MKKLQVRLSGTGGQGLILAGQILAEAVGCYEGKRVVQTQSYGAEARGGASRADVIISDQAILYPEVQQPDILVCLSQQAYVRYHQDLAGAGLLLYDPLFVSPGDAGPRRLVGIGATRAADGLGRRLVANSVSLGALSALTGAVRISSLRQAVLARVPRGTEELNTRALEIGYELGQSATIQVSEAIP